MITVIYATTLPSNILCSGWINNASWTQPPIHAGRRYGPGGHLPGMPTVTGPIIIIFNLRTAAFKAYCVIWVRRSNFHHQASPRVSPHESTQRRKVELWARNVRKFCLNYDFHVTLRDLLNAVKLWHGTDSFTFPPKEGMLRIFLP
jgi:hypothetical protein